MGLFSFLFRRPVVIKDDFFGRITSERQGQYGSTYRFHASKVLFHPIGATIECMIDTIDIGGPTPAQRVFFQHVEQVYASLLPTIATIVENDARLLTTGSPITNFALTHRLAGITIPEIQQGPVSWDMWFEPMDDSYWGYSILVDMIDDVPQAGIGISA